MAILNSLRASSTHTKQALRNIGRKFGFEVRLTGPSSRDDLRLANFLTIQEIDTILDVGANDGGFARTIFKAGFKGRVISFEPLVNSQREAEIASSSFGGRWIVAPPMALSDSEGTAKFNVTEGTTSSSLLNPTPEFVEDTPHVRVSEIVEVPTKRLDAVAPIYAVDPQRTLLKLDVQGGEARVLAGATELLPKLAGVLSEMSLTPLYTDQPDFLEVHSLLVQNGFQMWDIWPGHRHAKTLRLTQFDGLYFRPIPK